MSKEKAAIILLLTVCIFLLAQAAGIQQDMIHNARF